MSPGTPCLIALLLLAAVPCHARQCEWQDVGRVIAVGDVHGDLGMFRKVLTAADLIDLEDRWIAGKTHLVQTGDILDRGPDSRKVLDLLWNLGKQAQAAGGFVHILTGNHEAMVSGGDFRYVHKDEFISHGGRDRMESALARGGVYGDRIRSQNAVILIDDLLFLHGGLNTRYSRLEAGYLNCWIRNALAGGKTSAHVLGGEGPLWFRGYAEESETELWKRVRDLWEYYGARHVIAGHSVTIKGILLRCGGRVIQIDTGLSGFYGGPPCYLEMERGRISARGL
jgi:hypothetical protein